MQCHPRRDWGTLKFGRQRTSHDLRQVVGTSSSCLSITRQCEEIEPVKHFTTFFSDDDGIMSSLAEFETRIEV
jgi:hypothetical protein